MPLYDYRCENGHVSELRKGMGVESIPCPACGQQAVRVPFYATVELITETGVGVGYGRFKSPSEAIRNRHGQVRLDLFLEASAEMDHAHKKAEESVGKEIPSRQHWRQGLVRAHQMAQKGYRSRYEKTERRDS